MTPETEKRLKEIEAEYEATTRWHDRREDIPWLIAIVRMQAIALEDKWGKLGVPVIPRNCPTVKEKADAE